MNKTFIDSVIPNVVISLAPTPKQNGIQVESVNQECKKSINPEIDKLVPNKNKITIIDEFDCFPYAVYFELYSPDCVYKLMQVGVNDLAYAEGGCVSSPSNEDDKKYLGVWLLNTDTKNFEKLNIIKLKMTWAYEAIFEKWLDNNSFVFHGYNNDDVYKKYTYNILSKEILLMEVSNK